MQYTCLSFQYLTTVSTLQLVTSDAKISNLSYDANNYLLSLTFQVRLLICILRTKYVFCTFCIISNKYLTNLKGENRL